MNLPSRLSLPFLHVKLIDAVIDYQRSMAGLEVLYACVGGSVSCPQDAVVCFVHWEMIQSGYRCVGSGDEVSYLS